MKAALLLLAASAVVLSGCATNSQSVTAAVVSPVLYQNLTCKQLAAEAVRVSQAATDAAGQQDAQAGKDAAMVAVGAVLFWPALFFVGGNSSTAGELSRLKGEMYAIEQANAAKGCGIKFQR